jgi:hypothetical protein
MNTSSRTVYIKHGSFAETKKNRKGNGPGMGISSFGPNFNSIGTGNFSFNDIGMGFYLLNKT